jgi:hypothetical protein
MEDAAERQDLLVPHDEAVVDAFDALGRHAVGAAKVAPVCDGDADVVEAASVVVD